MKDLCFGPKPMWYKKILVSGIKCLIPRQIQFFSGFYRLHKNTFLHHYTDFKFCVTVEHNTKGAKKSKNNNFFVFNYLYECFNKNNTFEEHLVSVYSIFT